MLTARSCCQYDHGCRAVKLATSTGDHVPSALAIKASGPFRWNSERVYPAMMTSSKGGTHERRRGNPEDRGAFIPGC